MEDHLIVSSDEQKVLKKFKTRLEKRHHVVINMPDTVEFSESDVIFVSIVGEKYNIENVKKFLSERMKRKKEKIECHQSDVVLITLSDSEDSDSESKENSVCVVEELGSNYQNIVKKSTVYNSLDNSVLLIDCPEDSSKTNIITLQNVNKRKRKSKQERLKNKKARIKDILTTNEAEVCEISSTLDACEVSSTTEETIKKAQPISEKLADFIPLGQKKEKKQISVDKCAIVEKKADIILLEEPVSAPRPLRPIVIDGSNVAMEHGKVSHCFSAKGIQLAVEYFLKRGHTDVHAFVPKFRRISNPHHNFPTKDPEILDELAKKQLVVFTPSRRVNGKCIASYDDRFIVDLASRNGGVIVSNDNYRDLIGESESFKESIEKRLLMFCFVGDIFMIPSDPLGRNGPSLEEFLSFPPQSQT